MINLCKALILTSLLILCPTVSAVDLTDTARLSLDFNQVPTRALLLNVARFSHHNLLISPKIQGDMSIHLDSMPWPEVLDFIVQSQGLSVQRIGSLTYIETAAEAEPFQQQQKLEQRLITLSYTKADEMLALIKEQAVNLVSKRGSIGADLRTNTLWVEDLPEKVESIQHFVRLLDIQSPQISIEARIVTIDVRRERDLGLQFGLSSLHHLSGTLAGANAAQSNGIAQVPAQERLNFAMPALSGIDRPASIGLALAPLVGGYYLDLELSALEAQGSGKIIASPNLTVSNQQTATIEAGEDIPYQEKTSSGATNVTFKKAVLSLQVTPLIIHDQQILLKLKINQDRVGSLEVQGVPIIDTREIVTQVLTHNHQTIVLGGIYETDQQHQTQRIPFLSDLPWIGPLFSRQHDVTQKRELLIFVRPSLI